MIKTNFLDNVSYLPQDLTNQWASLLTEGVYSVSSGAFLVSAHSPANLSVDVASGAATKNGYYIKSDSVVNVSIVANTSGYNRIDIIVLEIDTVNKITNVKAVKGTASSSPTAPLPTANQLIIAQVYVGNNVSVINQANITDVRVNVDILNSSLAAKVNKTDFTEWNDGKGNGWKKNLVTGEIEQYMKVTTTGINANTPGIFTFNFPLAFSSTVNNIVLTDKASSTGTLISGLRVEANSLSAVSVKVNVPTYVDWVVLYIKAIGK